MARQARSNQGSPEGDSYYTVIRGKKYDRRMVELAEGLTQGRGDGRISINDAKNLLRVVKDSNNYSDTEKATMEYIRRHYRFTKEADEFFRSEIRKWAASKPKKKPAEKPAEKKKAPVSAAAPTVSDAAPPAGTPAHSQAKTGSAAKQILLALFLLLALAALFWYITQKISCARPVTAEQAKPAEPPAASPAPAAGNEHAAAQAPAATPAPAVAPVAPDLIEFVSQQKLIFIAEKSELSPASLKTLDALADRLKNNAARLRVTGHSCSLGEKKVNQEISEKRARVVKEALVARGVAAEKIETRGVADSEPAGDNKTVAGRVASRRVTFAIISQ